MQLVNDTYTIFQLTFYFFQLCFPINNHLLITHQSVTAVTAYRGLLKDDSHQLHAPTRTLVSRLHMQDDALFSRQTGKMFHLGALKIG